jgi:L-alanine-DL-glutamate epimerase-like enolase superfamily enzyme
MKITSISVFQVDLPFSGGTYLLSGGREYHHVDATVIRIETDAELEGWGESTPTSWVNRPAWPCASFSADGRM